ncbi:hypothetical protein D8B46_00605 [Candidatus Gracilibacteria bacterium]|nr:MAG: hypothetical protein D8B46_00605 [Candidatus Gracilibacteria bacterium]
MNDNIKILVFEALAKAFEEVKDLKDGVNNSFKVVASSEDIDRSGEIIKVDGWDDSNYKKNPVILSNHSYRVEDIVGKMTKIYKEGKNLIVEGIFTEKTEMGKICKDLYNAGFLKTVSVGFIVKKRLDEDRTIIEKAELLEVSFVAVPCNPNAVSLDKKILEKGFELGILKKEKEINLKEEIKNLSLRIEKLEKQNSENQKIFESLTKGKFLQKEKQEEMNISEIAENITKNIL